MKCARVFGGAVALAWLLVTGTAADTATLNPVKDNTLYESAAGTVSNGAGERFFVGRTNRGSIRRAVLAFDIASFVPEGSTITSARLTMRMTRTTSGARDVSLHRLLADWGEGTSNAGANEGRGTAAAPGDATWIHTFFDTEFWSQPGGDFVQAASASAQVAGPGFYTWVSTPELVADVQAWLDDPEGNFGWILIGNESTSRTTKRFESRQTPAPGNRPRLMVEFLVPFEMRTFELGAASLTFVEPGEDQFSLLAEYELGESSDGIDPEREDVTLTFGPHSEKLPAGSFTCMGSTCRFESPGPGITLAIINENVILFSVRDLDLSDTANPLDVSVLIGNDIGKASVRLRGSLVRSNKVKILLEEP